MALRYRLHIDAGSTFRREFEYTNPDGSEFDLTDYSAALQIRETPTSPLALSVTPDIDVENATISFTLTAAQTATLTQERYVYAIELTTPDDEVFRFVEGGIRVSPEVVR